MIRLDDVHVDYDGARRVLAGVSLRIQEGAHVAVLGRNGSGKSTLARLLNGLLTPARGTVLVDGLNPADPRDLAAVRRRVQMVFQNPENQQIGVTVFEDIAFGLSNIGHPTALMRSRAEEALAMVGLEVALDREVSTLSGGQLQRLALASSLALDPRVLVLDEVTSMLDPEASAHFSATLGALRATRPLTVVQITHALDEIGSADHAVVLDGGVIRAEGSPTDLFCDTVLMQECGLEPPFRWQPRRDGADPERPPVSFADRVPLVEARDLAVDHTRRRRSLLGAVDRAPRPTEVLRDVSVAVRPGELVALAGRSGAGKSTLVAALKGIVRAVRGSVLVGNVDPRAARRPEAFDRIGYVFQQPEHQLFASTVRADVEFGLATQRLSGSERSTRVDAALERMGLDPAEVASLSPFELSGGQQRRVAIAGVLVTDPDVIILDEPTAGLDWPSRTALFAVLHDIAAAGTGVLWVSHRFEEVWDHADRLVVIDDRVVVADGPPRELLADASLRRRMAWPLLPHLDVSIRQGDLLPARPEGAR